MKGSKRVTAVLRHELLSDDVLAVQSASGDPAAQAEWVSRFMPRIWRVVYLNCSQPSDVEDLVQTAMITALENLGAYQGPGKLRAWVDRLTLNVIRTHYRKNRFRRLFLSPLESDWEYPSRHNTAQQVENQQLLEHLSAHLAKINSKNREALVLSMLLGYGAKDIAEIVGCSVEAAWKRTRRGYEELMARVKRDPNFEESIRELLHE
jgi:RNA polymerase sigma factor (sigma-70 family)